MRRPNRRRGITLLEIILALAILAGAVAVLSQLNRGGMDNARIARDMTRAELLCQSKMAEIAAGLISVESQQGMFESETDPQAAEWTYSVEVVPAAQTGLLEVRVTVNKDTAIQHDPVEFHLTRWMADADTQNATSDTTLSSSADSGGGGGL